MQGHVLDYLLKSLLFRVVLQLIHFILLVWHVKQLISQAYQIINIKFYPNINLKPQIDNNHFNMDMYLKFSYNPIDSNLYCMKGILCY